MNEIAKLASATTESVDSSLRRDWAAQLGSATPVRSAFEADWRSRRRMDDAQWAKVLHTLPGRVGVRASNGGNARRFVEAVLWMAHTRAYWSDIPAEYGAWHAIYIRFGRWAHEGIWADVVEALQETPESQSLLRVMVENYLANYHMQRMREKMK
jgi:hypothetical protein